MNNKVKVILIAVEIIMLIGLIILGVSCQRRWIINTEDGPRLNWYGNEETTEDTTPKSEPIEELSTQPEPSETTPPPVVTSPPVTTEPEETTEEPTEESTEETTEPEDTTAPTSGGTREDELPRVPIS